MIEPTAESSSGSRERYYIRSAVDNMQRAVNLKLQLDATGARAHAEISYRLACFAEAISYAYSKRSHIWKSPAELESFLTKLSSIILGGQPLLNIDRDLPTHIIQAAVKSFMTELLIRFNTREEQDTSETLALIEFRMRFISTFYKGGDRRITEAVNTYFLICKGEDVPAYSGLDQLRTAADALPSIEDPTECINYIKLSEHELNQEPYFIEWKKIFREKFGPIPPAQPVSEKKPSTPWDIIDSSALDHQSTTYDINNVGDSHSSIDMLRKATGKRPELLVVFRPRRMALHETIAIAVTHIKMKNPTDFLSQHILNEQGIFHTRILPQIVHLENQFNDDWRMFDRYSDYLLDDHFSIVNPNMEIRRKIDSAKNLLIKRIEAGLYNSRMVESRAVFHDLVANDLLRQWYHDQIHKIVKTNIFSYLDSNSSLRLPLKTNSERLAWITVGGPASGKSSLERLILREYAQFVGRESYLVQVNSDHYKPLLLPKDGSDHEHGARTYWESGQVRQRIIDILQHMISVDNKAPDFWVSTMTPSEDRMGIAGIGGKIQIYVVSCDVEGENGALQRAFRRANDPNSEDFHRFMSAKDILRNHKDASFLLPEALNKVARDLRLFNSDKKINTLTASMDSYNKEMRIFDPAAFLKFLRKNFINQNARSEAEIYLSGPSHREIASEICRYAENKVSLNFRYSEHVPNSMVEKLRTTRVKEQDKVAHKMMQTSQPETYIWIGHERAHVRDFSAMVKALGQQMSEALLIELGSRWQTRVRDYHGNLLFSVDIVDGKPQSLIHMNVDSSLTAILNGVKDALSFDPEFQI